MRTNRTISALACLALATGCAGSTVSSEPLMLSVVCADGLETGCDPATRASLFSEWVSEAIHRPGSTMTVWVAGERRESSRLLFAIRVPASWGRDVMAAKASFLREGAERAAAMEPQASPDATAAALVTDETPPEGDQLIVLSRSGRSLLAIPVEPETPEMLHAAFLYDRSSSMLGTSCDVPHISIAFQGWLSRGGLIAGSTLTVWTPGTSRESAIRSFSITTPATGFGQRAAFLLGAGHELEAWLAARPPDKGSAIAEALSVVAEHLQERQGRRVLAVFSDLREVSGPHMWNFERYVPSPRSFTNWLRANGLLADLNGVAVTVCGTHHQSPAGTRFDARHAARVVSAWDGALRAMNVTNPIIRSDCPEGPGASQELFGDISPGGIQ